MKDIKVKEVMIPISNYVAVNKDSSLIDVLRALESDRSEKQHAHRDAIVIDDNGDLIGKITMIDIFRSLEPNYKNINMEQTGGVLTREFVMKSVKDFNLWMEPLQDLCQRGALLKVTDVMHAPKKVEYIDENETLEKALNQYVMGVHQPLIVKHGDKVTGILRFGDLFEIVRERLLACAVV